MLRNVIYISVFGFISAIALGAFFSFSSEWLTALIALAALCALLGLFGKARPLLFLALFLFSFAVGVLRVALMPVTPPAFLETYAAQKTRVTLEGRVIREPDVREDHTNLTVRVYDAMRAEAGSVLLVAPRAPAYHFGDTVRISGTLVPPEPMAEDGRVFNYPKYLQKDGIFFLMYYPDIALLSSEPAHIFTRTFVALLMFKERFLFALAESIPDPESALLAGILLGAKRALGDTLLEAFRVAGLVHLVVLSGYNISLVADFVRILFSRTPRTLYLVLSGLALFVFAMLTGFGATVLRATLMGFLVVLARTTGRTYDALHALVLAGFLMVLYEPLILAYDPSFQLSFLATFGLIAFGTPIEARLSFITSRWGLRSMCAATLAAQISVLPLIVYLMGNFSLVATFANILVLPIIAPLMALGACLGALFFISPLLAMPFAFCAYLGLRYIIFVAETAASLPFASMSFPAFPLWVLVFLYAPIAFFAYRVLRVPEKRVNII